MKKFRASKFFWATMTTFFAILVTIVVLNITLVRTTESKNVDAEGQIELSNIAWRVEKNLYRSESLLDGVIMQLEPMLADQATARESLTQYFNAENLKTISDKSGGSCFSAYAAYEDVLYINDFVPDENFVLNEREWYTGAKRKMGKVNVSDPYIDANTGEMCYSISKLLTDGQTVVGLDFSMNELQTYIEEMNSSENGSSMIVNKQGVILGHSNPEYVGQNYTDLPFYSELVNKVYMLYGDFFEYKADGVWYNIFSDKTNYDWYLIVCVKKDALQVGMGLGAMSMIGLIVLLLLLCMVFFAYLSSKKERVQAEANTYKKQLEKIQQQLYQTLIQIKDQKDFLENENFSDAKLKTNTMEAMAKLGLSMEHLTAAADIVDTEPQKTKKKTRPAQSGNVNYRKISLLITLILVLTSLFAIIFNTQTQVEWGKTKMQKESDQYLYQVQSWVTSNSATLDVIANSIAAQPGFENQYNNAIRYLDTVVANYEDISVAYLCNPQWTHTVLMNNGWEPDSNWHVEERQWYIDTMQSNDGFNIASPYLDEQTGLYCITLSKIVYDKSGNFVGVLGIDYYLDKLVDILGKSYTDTGYAFLTDRSGNILNHPYEPYQMKPNESQNAANLCYRTAMAADGAYFIWDYDGTLKVCQAVTENNLGFGIIVVRDLSVIYGNAVLSDLLYLCIFITCTILISLIMKKLSRWQLRVNMELKDAADHAIRAGKAKNNFLANMSHEIRTPINAVLGMNEMILRESTEKEIKEYAANIQSAGRTLLSLINDILDFSKIESGKMEIIPVQYDVSSLINDLVQMIKLRADKKNLDFTVEIDEKIPAVLYGDDVRIRQIITNILTNAVKYTASGSVKLQMLLLEKKENTARIKVSVSDTGIGIREEDLDKLFQSFQRLEQEKNRNIEGTGLGITIVQRLLQMMGSELHVSSIYGTGSTFSFAIDQRIVGDEMIGDYEARFKESADPLPEQLLQTAPDAHVLIVDDNDTNLMVAKSLLKRTKVQTDTASSGKECLEKLRTQFYHVVFLDHMMPEMDGLETLAEIKKEKLAENTTFVALTANAIRGAKENYLQNGFDDYLSKPINGIKLEKCLFSHLPKELIVSEAQNEAEKAALIETAADTQLNSAYLNLNTGLMYVGGNLQDYQEILRGYVTRGKENLHHIQQLFDDSDWKSYVIAVHALKSSSLSIGAEALSEQAKALELEGKSENYDYILKHHHLTMELYEKVLETGTAYLDSIAGQQKPQDEQDAAKPASQNSPAAHTAEELFEVLSRLKEACDAFYSEDVLQICEELQGYTACSDQLVPFLEGIKACAESFNFDDAAEKTELFRQSIQGSGTTNSGSELGVSNGR